jgi:hypothetical protein
MLLKEIFNHIVTHGHGRRTENVPKARHGHVVLLLTKCIFEIYQAFQLTGKIPV